MFAELNARWVVGSVAVALVIVLVGAFFGSYSAKAELEPQLKNAKGMVDVLSEEVSDRRAEAEYLRSSVETLTAQVESMTAEIKEVKKQNEDKDAEIERLEGEKAALQKRQQPVSRSSTTTTREQSTASAAPAPAPLVVPSNGHTGVWSADKLAGVLSAACDQYGISGANKNHVVSKGVSIARKESTFDTQNRNPRSSATGLFQFLKAWGTSSCSHGIHDWRLCGTCSTYRFVRVYAETGDSGLRSHWAETY